MTDHSAPTRGLVAVTSQDHEAYIQLEDLSEGYAARVRAGEWDQVTGVQIIARHRLAAIEECAKIANGLVSIRQHGTGTATVMASGPEIAQAIRNLGRGV